MVPFTFFCVHTQIKRQPLTRAPLCQSTYRTQGIRQTCMQVHRVQNHVHRKQNRVRGHTREALLPKHACSLHAVHDLHAAPNNTGLPLMQRTLIPIQLWLHTTNAAPRCGLTFTACYLIHRNHALEDRSQISSRATSCGVVMLVTDLVTLNQVQLKQAHAPFSCVTNDDQSRRGHTDFLTSFHVFVTEAAMFKRYGSRVHAPTQHAKPEPRQGNSRFNLEIFVCCEAQI